MTQFVAFWKDRAVTSTLLKVGVGGQIVLWMLCYFLAASLGSLGFREGTWYGWIPWAPVSPGILLAIGLYGKPRGMEDVVPLLLGFVLNCVIYTVLWLGGAAFWRRWRGSR